MVTDEEEVETTTSASEDDGGDDDDDSFFGWWIPVSYSTVGDPAVDDFQSLQPRFFMTPEERTLEARLDDLEEEPFVFNVQQTGFYRVNYDDSNWRALAEALVGDHSAVHMLNRAQLLDDSYSLAEASTVDYSVPLSLSEYLPSELEAVPIYAAMVHLMRLGDELRFSDSLVGFRDYVDALTDASVERLGIDETDEFDFMDNWLR